MARFRLARPAERDLGNILATSAAQWGEDARRRYAACLVSAMREVALRPHGPLTRSRTELGAGLRSFHIGRTRNAGHRPTVKRPVHILYYRLAQDGVIEIVRVLHDRMDPSRHVEDPPT
jgi:toxin ParE1/3/4